jgi:DNA-binding PucR family transcriptional regulator
MPQVLTLWDAAQKGDDHYHTLEVWLACERSASKTAAMLYTHRNTVQYRLRKVQEMCDLEDPKIRAYCGLSIMVLNLYSRKKQAEDNKQ